MASMREIKRRRESIQNTKQITKAMKLVSTAKLQKAKVQAEHARIYEGHFKKGLFDVLSSMEDTPHKYQPFNGKGKALIVITSNRGLAGGYNNNILRMIGTNPDFSREDTFLFAIGLKGKEGLSRQGYQVVYEDAPLMEHVEQREIKKLCDSLLSMWFEGSIGEIHVAYTMFENTIHQTPVMKQLLPCQVMQSEGKKEGMEYEPGEEEILDFLIPEYLNVALYTAVLESIASEHGARMMAMEAASNNADEMIEELSFAYNRARQGNITKELTEIIAGASAIGSD